MDYLSIQSNLDHDGDGIVRFRISARNIEFSASAVAWGNEDETDKLADLLRGFPKSFPSSVEYEFGSPGTGQCNLKFETIDRTGHCCVWASVKAAYGSGGQSQHQRADVCIKFVPASLDKFILQLQRFKQGQNNEAKLEKVSA